MAAARTPGPATTRISPWRHHQDPDPVPSRIRPGAAAPGGPRHQCGAASLAARAPERDPGDAARSEGRAGPRRDASCVDGVAGGPDEALHVAARPTAAAAVAGVGQSHRPQDARAGAVAVRAWD